MPAQGAQRGAVQAPGGAGPRRRSRIRAAFIATNTNSRIVEEVAASDTSGTASAVPVTRAATRSVVRTGV
jgi:hypothetical protein